MTDSIIKTTKQIADYKKQLLAVEKELDTVRNNRDYKALCEKELKLYQALAEAAEELVLCSKIKVGTCITFLPQ